MSAIPQHKTSHVKSAFFGTPFSRVPVPSQPLFLSPTSPPYSSSKCMISAITKEVDTVKNKIVVRFLDYDTSCALSH